MTKSALLLTSSLMLVSFILQAQDCTFYFPSKVGTTMEMKHYNAKDKLTATSKTTIIGKTGNSIKFTSEFWDEKDTRKSSGEYEVHCKNGDFIVDMSAFTRTMNLEAYKDMDVSVESDEMSIPASLQPGMKLSDGEVRIKISNKGIAIMNMTVKIYNRVVAAKEDITTPAGTFSCYRITYDVDSKVIFKTQYKGVEWLSQTAGMVRTESHDTKGKMLAYSVLSEIK